MKIAITGATGYIGSSLVIAVKEVGGEILALSRRRPTDGCEWLHYDLNQSDINLPANITCVVHLAMNFEVSSNDEIQQEVNSAICLLNASKKINAKFIFISSQTATENASTMYGKAKWEIEKIVQSYGGIIIRPGLVYGGQSSGLFLHLTKLMHKLPVIPFFFPAPKVQPIHVKDLCNGIIKLAQTSLDQTVFCLASVNPIKFHTFLKLLCEHKLRKFRLYVPLPSFIISAGHRLLPKSNFFIRLHSLFTLPELMTQQDLSILHLRLRELNVGLHPSGSNNRRLLLKEGFIFFSYLLGKKPSPFMIRRYVKVVEVIRNKVTLDFSNVLSVCPFLLFLLDNNMRIKDLSWFDEFSWRLNAATSLSEASVEGAKRFLRIGKYNSVLTSFWICSKVVFNEFIARLFTLIIGKYAGYLVTTKVVNK